MVDIQELSDDSSSSRSQSSSSKRDSMNNQSDSSVSSSSSSSSSLSSFSKSNKKNSSKPIWMNNIWKDESSDTNDEGNNSSNDPVRKSNHRLNQSRLTFLFDSDSHSSNNNTSPNIKSKEQEQEQEQEPSESSSSSLDSSSPFCDSAMDSIVREQDAHYIQSKYGNQNILLDNDTSFSYATSKLFASIAAAGGAVPDKSDEADIEPDRNRTQVETYCSSKDPSNDRNEEVYRISHTSRLVTNPYAKKAKSDCIWNNATRTQIHGSNKRHTEQGQNESKSSGTTAYDRNSNCDSLEPLEKKQLVQSQQRESSYPVIHPSFYKPPPFQPKPEPNVHKMNIHTRPLAKRTNISISSLFPASGSSPTKNIVDFWKSKYHSLNHMQTELAHKIVHSEDNIVVSAPTGAGKTCIFEMAMGSLLQSSQTAGSIPNTKKIVYISPSKALCDERYNDWSTRFIQVDPAIEVVVVTGDDNSSGNSFQNVASAHVILTTPEKWDSITRKWTDHLALLSSVKLLMIDEVHLLGDESRGSCLETLICRMKTVQRAASASKEGVQKRNHQSHASILLSGWHMRIVCVSATLPNINDIASFVDASDAYEFDSSYRPVPLTTHVVGLGYVGKNQFLFDKGLNKHVPDLLRRFSNDKPSLVFCHTKKQTESLASELSAHFDVSRDTRLAEFMSKTSLELLRRCLRSGVAYHHAGMEGDDRHMVERAFAIGAVKCLCATSTLAMGVNLPAHLVIIKGTTCWRGSGQGYNDIDTGTLLQMMGRAGRPGFDVTGTAVIMTDMKSKANYERLSGGLEVVESMLLKNLVETLNTEISQCVINNVSEAIDWLKGTFFYLRVRKNPRCYKLFGKSQEELESYLMKLCMDALENLHSSGIIQLQNQGSYIIPNPVSHIMSKHMVPFRTVKLMIDLPYDSESAQILRMLSQMEGIHYPVRRAEKSLLNEAHKQIKYKLDGSLSKVRIQNPEQKAFVLLQCAIGHIYLQDYTLRQEMSTIVEYSKRMLAAFEDYCIEESRHGKIALECMLLRRCLATSLWGPSDYVLNQIQGIGLKTASKLAMNGIHSFADILTKSSNAIEDSCGRTSPFGQQLRTAASKILRKSLRLSAYIQDVESPIGEKDLIVQLTYRNEKDRDDNADDNDIVTYTLSVYTDRPGGSIMFRTNICDPCVHKISCPNSFGRIYIRLVANLVGLDESLQIEGNSELAKSTSLFSPKPSSAAKKRKKEVSSSKPNLPSTMNDMVADISDMRMKRNSMYNFETDNKALTPMSSSKTSQYVPDLHQLVRQTSMVTPSPHTPTKHVSVASQFAFDSYRSAQSDNNKKLNLSGAYSSYPIKRMRAGSSNKHTWQREKKEQQNLQQRAFRSPKENPFAAFKFDPNDVEKVLEQESKKSLSEVNDGYSVHSSIIPPNTGTIGYEYGIHSQRRSRFYASGRKPTQYKSSFVGSARRSRVGSAHAVTSEDLLRLKAQEQQTLVYSGNSHPWRGVPFHGQSSQIEWLPKLETYAQNNHINNQFWSSKKSYVHDPIHPMHDKIGNVCNGIDHNYFDVMHPHHEWFDNSQQGNACEVNAKDEYEAYFPPSCNAFHALTHDYGFPRGTTEAYCMNQYQASTKREDVNPFEEQDPFSNDYLSRQNDPENLQGMVITVEGKENDDENFDEAFL